MSEKAATGAKRVRANTDEETYEEEQEKLVQEIHELKKVIKILADTQLQYIKYFESADGKLDKIHEKNIRLYVENTKIKESVQTLLYNIIKNKNTIFRFMFDFVMRPPKKGSNFISLFLNNLM